MAQTLDHRWSKSLKDIYLVHSTFGIKFLVWMARCFVSTKYRSKLIYVQSLEELTCKWLWRRQPYQRN
ncbi:rho GTPase-activating protein 68F [Drosophila grimshawi]|uniref:rho GTPase-activating protein 68F n=1 Tax=Drosophila grimshawi TaxID=7222 RepID=UPI001C932598|nr:rho GTPase-activating protein 68F [Drosophila grimshawi]